VPSEGSLNSSGFIFFLGKITAGGIKQPVEFKRQTTAKVWPPSAQTTLKTKLSPSEKIT
jgi:hypothetical protein